jgi:hypothetical protein
VEDNAYARIFETVRISQLHVFNGVRLCRSAKCRP